MTTTTQDPRITELLDWQKETGRPLPMPLADILWWEDHGMAVDLMTGDVLDPDTFGQSFAAERGQP